MISDPLVTGVKEIAVTGPHSPTIHSIDDLSGQEVFVRKSSSYWEHLEALNPRFKSQGKAPVKLRAAPEDLEDEDLLEMLNAGLVPIVVTNAYLPKMWETIYTNIRGNPDVVVDDAGQIAWATRKNSPKLADAVNQFVKMHKQGTAFGNAASDQGGRCVLPVFPRGMVHVHKTRRTVEDRGFRAPGNLHHSVQLAGLQRDLRDADKRNRNDG